MDYDVLIIGCGVIGASIARELSRYNLSVCVLEKNNDIGEGASGSNSAIIHSGYDPKPNTLKQKFNVFGNPMFDKLCKELDVPFKRIGSLTVATTDEEIAELKKAYEQGVSYNVPVNWVEKEHLKEYEPNINDNIKCGLYAPTCGIIDPFSLVNHLVENAMDNGVTLLLNSEVSDIIPYDGGFNVVTNNGDHTAKVVINCAGVYSDKIASLIEPISWSIEPRKGQYYVIDHLVPPFVKHTVFPAPSKVGKGILVSPTTAGDYIVGPSNEDASNREDVGTNIDSGKAIKSKANEMINNIPFKEEVRVFSGLRAHPSTDDFIIEASKTYQNFINCGGIESPGLTSSPAIAEYVVNELVAPILPLKAKANFNPYVRPYIKVKDLPIEEVNKLIASDPNYGIIICYCEKVTLGEILDLYSRSVPINSVKAIKRRTCAGMGKCQGGFCYPKLVKALSEYLGKDMNEIVYDGKESYILKEKVKV